LTYEGLLEGLPTEEMNKEMLEHLLASQRDQSYRRAPYLITPTEKRIEYPLEKPYPFGKPSALPDVTCIGRFESLAPARDQECDLSGLVVIWFQDEFALPIDSSVLDHIRAIDWETHAADFKY
jgi:hypothetical protein